MQLLMDEPLLTEEEARAEIGVAGRTRNRTSEPAAYAEKPVFLGPFRISPHGQFHRTGQPVARLAYRRVL